MTSGQEPVGIRYKSAAAARLADIPVATLRVWERRYAVVSPRTTESGQRLYGPEDIHRLVLIKRLVAQGHAIGAIAPLQTRELEEIAAEIQPGREASVQGSRAVLTRVGVVGQSLSARVDAWLLQRAERASGVHVQCHFSGIAEALAKADARNALDVIIIQVPSLRLSDARDILSLMGIWRCRRAVVLYGFGTGAAARTLQAFGVQLRRGPLIGLNLEALLQAQAEAPPEPPPDSPVAAPPRYSDAVLDRVTEVKTSISCECPKHVASLISQLMAFERYSADCLTDHPADSAVHAELARTAGLARAMFERSLEELAAAHGFDSILTSETPM